MEYKELVQMWEDGRRKWEKYKWAVGGIAAFIENEFRDRLNITDENIIRLFPESESDEQKLNSMTYAPYACVEFKDEGWSSVGLIILLEKNKNTWPKSNYKFYMNIKRLHDGNWNVRLAEDGKTYTVSATPSKKDIDPIFEEFIDILKFNTIDQLDNWLN